MPVSFLLVLVPLLCVIFANMPLGKAVKKLLFYFVLLFSLAQVYLVVCYKDLLTNGTIYSLTPVFKVSLAIDSLSLLLLLTIPIITVCALFIGWFTIKDEVQKYDFTSMLLMSLTGMNGLVMVNDIFSMYVFLEIVAISSFILIAFYTDIGSLEGAFKYIILSAVATILMLTAIAVFFTAAGDTSFVSISNAIKGSGRNTFLIAAMSIFVGGLLIKGGIAPFHGWVADAYSSAPAAVSVLLAGIITKVAGIYTLIRIVTTVFGFTPQLEMILLFFGAFSIILGALIAMVQKDMKRMLAYSSISQMGYIVLSLGTGTALGIAGAVFHLFNHAIFKAGLFANSAAVEEAAGTRDMDKLGGLSSKMPVTGFTSLVSSLSTAGIPPLSGFWSKLVIIIALWSSGHFVYAIIAVLASLLTLAYFLSMQRRVFFGKLKEEYKDIKEARFGVIFPAIMLSLITIGVGIFFFYVLDTFMLPVKSILG
ncbi:MAG: NADH-quinone oxidoreductase subunit L [Elusimicrobia bacterium]|nr:NADH-quinone oxidoreductase subunit L [Candidatus Liberimonas magnetica]